MEMKFNKCQTPLEELGLDKQPKEVQEQFWDFINNVPFIRWMVSPDRPLISELPRDEYGRAIIDVTKPPILEGSDYFRQTAKVWEETGKYTSLRPNINPNSDFGRWLTEERRRGWEGLVNPDTGMWVTGDYYWMLNYCPMHMIRKNASGLTQRVVMHPNFWDGQFLVTHYFNQARLHGHHAAELASRGKGKTSLGAAMLSRRFEIGETFDNTQEIQCFVTAADRTKLTNPNQILSVFVDNIDFCAKNTQFDRMRLRSSNQEMTWKMGYNKSGSNVEYGSRNTVTGVITGVNQDKLNGSRGVLYLIEEAGIFKDLKAMYNMIRPSVEQGTDVFGLITMYGTAGDSQSDFIDFADMIYSPEGFNLEPLENVFDKEGQGRRQITMFYPVYLNYDSTCMDKDGNSDVTKALLMVCADRYKVKYGTSDINTITKRISQYPVTPQEAIIRSQGNVFPVTELNERLNQIDNNPNEYDDVYVGNLVQDKEGKVLFEPSGDIPIRDFPTKDNKVVGALEIYSMPQKDSNGEVPYERYLISLDPFDSDVAQTMSLGSCLVMDLWTDTIVAEYTGRPQFAEDLYEKVRLLCLFYNTKCMYEQNIMGTYSYFSSHNSLHLLADTPEYLKERQMIGSIGYGNKAHPYSEKVYTPEGIKLWGDIKIGDKLFSSYGTETTVIDIPFDAVTDIYEITLRDGRKVRASENHLWRVIDYNDIKKTLSTKQMLEDGYTRNRGNYNECKYYIPKNEGVEFPRQNLPLPPYFLGLMLGDGCFTRSLYNRANFASSIRDLEMYKQNVPYECKTVDDRHHWWVVPHIGSILRELDLIDKKSHTKFIPSIYKYGSREDRLSLLQGILDTDGYIGYGGNAEYCTVSKQLCEDVMEVARSLGINCNIQYRSNDYGVNYKVVLYTDVCLFKLPRKASKQRITKKRSIKTGIVNIEYVGKERAKCVTVDASDNCYLVGDFIVTHNSKGIRATTPIINGAFKMINSWLKKPIIKIQKDAEGNDVEVSVPNLYNLRNRALIKELIQWNPYGNYDRVLSLCQLILYREEKMVLYQGNLKGGREQSSSGFENDSYWDKNYKGKRNADPLGYYSRGGSPSIRWQ